MTWSRNSGAAGLSFDDGFATRATISIDGSPPIKNPPTGCSPGGGCKQVRDGMSARVNPQCCLHRRVRKEPRQLSRTRPCQATRGFGVLGRAAELALQAADRLDEERFSDRNTDQDDAGGGVLHRDNHATLL